MGRTVREKGLYPSKAMRRIHDKMDGKATGAIYKGMSTAKLSIYNNPVLFQDKVSRVLSNADGGVWALTPGYAPQPRACPTYGPRTGPRWIT